MEVMNNNCRPRILAEKLETTGNWYATRAHDKSKFKVDAVQVVVITLRAHWLQVRAGMSGL
jgi:hypothetical protein